MVKVIVEHQADVNADTGDGLTPLHSAIDMHSFDIMRYLLQHQVDANHKDSGKTPLHRVAIDVSLSAIDRLHAVETLIEYNANLNARDENGFIPLSCASRIGDLEVLKVLVRPPATNLSISSHEDNFHRTPLHWAVYRRHLHVAKFLIESGIDMRVVDGYGRTALDWASMDQAQYHDILDTNYQPTPESTRLQTLRQSVERLSRRLLEGKQESISAGLHDLGHCLAFLNDSSSARFSFQQGIAAVTEADEQMHRGTCRNGLDVIVTEARTHDPGQFVCSTCPDTTLCATCLGSHPAGRDFIEISQPTEEDYRGWKATREVPVNVQVWLTGLIAEYDGAESVVKEKMLRAGR